MVILVVLGAFFVLMVVAAIMEQKKVDAMSPAERERYLAQKQEASETLAHGRVNPAMICPHCGVRGKVRTKVIDKKSGISGGKATAAVLTGGVSLVATGLSRKDRVTRAFCGNCKNEWDF